MIDAKRKIIFSKTSIKAFAKDILLGLLVGSLISLLVCVGFYTFKGSANPLEIVPMFFALILINSPYSYLFRLVLLVPIYAPVVSMLLTRRVIQKTNSRKSWIFPILSVAAVSALAAVIITIVGLAMIDYGDGVLYLKLIAISPLFIFLGFLAGILPGYLFAPTRRIFKTLMAVISSTVVGACFEIAFLSYIVQ